ncbi:hypothetical protein C0W38_08810 [Photobacterium angustum]|uniref:hypothetical protein n=1 Tax=Photobacterium angustum TaxID=661 RepID=UPI0005E00F4C|nr:hypothetical protein [Photobacterium angustum]KJG32873.1 hypothetical protein UA36_05370 [Photobacterium angustum]PSV65504.1 hypothetical protein CTM95_15255 [Photobacterium angustum]PSW97489.1 hypothetical protein C0W79_04425 [Photobacterium angustum]PSX00427.1 hypothetical protein C0W87_17935 [Photobacterium angustum]PSX36663.1 hypothetical protein C0W38_08810 [Photobacterium angustum]
MKHRIGLLSLVLLAGCGGGGGNDNEKKSIEQPKEVEPICGDMVEMSCTYNVEDLTPHFGLSIEDNFEGSQKPLRAHGSTVLENTMSKHVYFDEIDKMKIVSEGVEFEPDFITSFPRQIFSDLPLNSTFELYWYRNGDIVSHAYVDTFPAGMMLFGIETEYESDQITFSWHNKSDSASNAGEILYLKCIKNDGLSNKMLFPEDLAYQFSLSSPYTPNLTLKELFDYSLYELEDNFKSCEITVKIHTTDNNIKPINYTNKKMKVHLERVQLNTASIF